MSTLSVREASSKMAILSVIDVSHREGATANYDDITGSKTAIWQLLSDSTTESDINIIAGVGVDIYDPHPTSVGLVARRFSIRREAAHRRVYFLEIEYNNTSDQNEPEDPDPLQRQLRIRWRAQTYQKFVWKDRNGDAIVNSVGEFFENVPSVDDTRWVIQVESNQSVVPSWVLSYDGKINDSGVTIDNVSFAAETLKMQNLNISELLYQNETAYRRVTFDLHYRSEGWKLEILDAGYFEVDPQDQIVFPIQVPLTDALGNRLPASETASRRRPTSPWPLNGSGEALTDPSPGQQVFLEFDVYPTADFSALPGVS